MTSGREKEMNEPRNAHPRRARGQIFRVPNRVIPKPLVVAIQEERSKLLASPREVEEVLRVEPTENLEDL